MRQAKNEKMEITIPFIENKIYVWILFNLNRSRQTTRFTRITFLLPSCAGIICSIKPFSYIGIDKIEYKITFKNNGVVFSAVLEGLRTGKIIPILKTSDKYSPLNLPTYLATSISSKIIATIIHSNTA